MFPSCRIFREGEAAAGSAGDFTNMVIFCKKSDSKLEFRQPTKADYLGSMSRESYMFPEIEIEQKRFQNNLSPNVKILENAQMRELQTWHKQSAIGHWKIMRTVLPDSVWEKW